MKALCWHGKSDMRYETVPDPENRGPARRHHQGHGLRHLRLRPAHLQRRHPGDGERRRHRPRDHGRGRRGRQRQQEAEGRRPGGGALHHLLRRMLLLPARILFRAASAPIPTRPRPRSFGVIRPPACSAIPICWVDIREGRPNICGCRLPTSGRSRCRST